MIQCLFVKPVYMVKNRNTLLLTVVHVAFVLFAVIRLAAAFIYWWTFSRNGRQVN